MASAAIIIANWNGKKYLKDCFESLRGQTFQDFKTIFVDNGSTDGSVGFVRDNYPEVDIIRLKENTGFAYPNNLGIKRAFEDKEVKYIITLNNDTKVESNFLEELLDCAKNHPKAGSIQPKVINFFEKNKLDCVGIATEPDGTGYNCGSQEKDEGQYDEEKEIFGASACAALYKKEILEKIKLPEDNFFDSDYFAYYEDTDLAWRIRLAGYKSFYCPKAKVFHIHSGTAGNFSAFKAFYLHRNRLYTIIKNFPSSLILKAIIMSETKYLLTSLFMIKKRGRDREYIKKQGKVKLAKVVLKALGEVIINIPSLLRKRRIIQKNKKVGGREIAGWFRKYGVKFSKTF